MPRSPRPYVADELREMPVRLREARVTRGHSFRSWAEYLTSLGFEVRKSMLQAYEDGTHAPAVDYVLAVHKAAGASLVWLLTGQGESGLPPSPVPREQVAGD